MKRFLLVCFISFSFMRNVKSQEIIIQPPVIPEFGCTELYQLFLGSVTNFTDETFKTLMFVEVNYTDPSGKSIKLVEGLFRGNPTIDFPKGTQIISGANYDIIYPNRKLKFFDKELENIISTDKCLPPGDYDICLTLYTDPGGAIDKPSGPFLTQTCFTRKKEMNNNLFLVSPWDESENKTPLPLFTWTPVIPPNIKGSYTIQIVEILDHQTAWDAFRSNPIYFEQNGLKNNLLLYPVKSRPFESCKKFAWQVVYSVQDGFTKPNVNKPLPLTQQSEIWTFTTPCAIQSIEIEREIYEFDSQVYNLVSTQNEGTYHIVEGDYLRFIDDSPYKEKDYLTYQIINQQNQIVVDPSQDFILNENIMADYYNLPSIQDYGNNKFVLEIDYSLAMNTPYTLVIYTGKNIKRYLRFIRK